jgi:hypothetical protein
LTVSEDLSRYQTSKEIREALVDDLFRPDLDTLMGLTSLGNNCANRIASAFDHLDAIRTRAAVIPLGAYHPGLDIRGASQELLDEWSTMLGRAQDLLQVALRECIKASKLAAPIPTGDEIYGHEGGN